MTTKTTMIRYRTRPECADENQRAVEEVFSQLASAAPPSVRYLTLRLPDATFVHVVMCEDGADASAVTELPAFRVFQDGVRARCVEPPRPSDAIVVGTYRMEQP